MPMARKSLPILRHFLCHGFRHGSLKNFDFLAIAATAATTATSSAIASATASATVLLFEGRHRFRH